MTVSFSYTRYEVESKTWVAMATNSRQEIQPQVSKVTMLSVIHNGTRNLRSQRLAIQSPKQSPWRFHKKSFVLMHALAT
jgi:hypothetical protein